MCMTQHSIICNKEPYTVDAAVEPSEMLLVKQIVGVSQGKQWQSPTTAAIHQLSYSAFLWL